MRARIWQAGLLASVGMLLVVLTLHAGENNEGQTVDTCPSGSLVPPMPPPPPLLCNPAATVPTPIPPGLTSDETFVRELIAILGDTHSDDAFLVTLSILHELKADPRLAVPAIIRNAERLKLFACTKPDQVTENQRMVADCIAGLIKRDSAPMPVCVSSAPVSGEILNAVAGALLGSTAGSVTPGAPVSGLGVSEDPSASPSAGVTKPTSGEVIPGNAKSRRIRKW